MTREHELITAELAESKRSLSVATARSTAQAGTIAQLESQLVRRRYYWRACHVFGAHMHGCIVLLIAAQASRPTVDLSADLRARDARIAELQGTVASLQSALAAAESVRAVCLSLYLSLCYPSACVVGCGSWV